MHEFIRHLFYLLQHGMILVIPAVLICAAVLALAWGVFRAKKRPFPWKKAIATVLLVGWFAITLFVTVLRHESYVFRPYNFQLFRAWIEAWNQFTLQSWLNVMLNIALFVPLGFLLPILCRWVDKWYRMLLAGFGTSLLVECIQLITCRGIFDVDDLFTNTLGAMLGWSMMMLLRTLLRRENGWGKRCCAYLALPASFALVMAGLFGYYAVKPYGNLPNAAVGKADLRDVQWMISAELENTPSTAPVFWVGGIDKEDSAQFVQAFAEQHDITFEEIAYCDTMIIYMNHSSGDFLDHYYRDGTWEYSMRDDHRPVFTSKLTELKREEVEAVLESWGITVPTEAAFTLEKEGDVFANAIFTVDLAQAGDDLVHGSVKCKFQEIDGKTYMTELENSMVTLTPRKEEEILTPEQAIQKLQAGRSFEGGWLARYKPSSVEVRSCTLDWLVDTKGFYQPVYRMELSAPEVGEVIDFVPAL